MLDELDIMNEKRDGIVKEFFETMAAYKADPDHRRKPRLRRLAELADNTAHGYGSNPDPLLPLTTDNNLKKWVAGDFELGDAIVNGCRELPGYMTLREQTHRAA